MGTSFRDFKYEFGFNTLGRFKPGDYLTVEANKGVYHIGIFAKDAPNEGLRYILKEGAVCFYPERDILKKTSTVVAFSGYNLRLSTPDEIELYDSVK